MSCFSQSWTAPLHDLGSQATHPLWPSSCHVLVPRGRPLWPPCSAPGNPESKVAQLWNAQLPFPCHLGHEVRGAPSVFFSSQKCTLVFGLWSPQDMCLHFQQKAWSLSKGAHLGGAQALCPPWSGELIEEQAAAPPLWGGGDSGGKDCHVCSWAMASA